MAWTYSTRLSQSGIGIYGDYLVMVLFGIFSIYFSPGRLRERIGVLYTLHPGQYVGSGIQFSSDRSDDPCLIKCVIHGRSDMVPWTRMEGTQDGRMLIDLTSEFTLLYWQFV